MIELNNEQLLNRLFDIQKEIWKWAGARYSDDRFKLQSKLFERFENIYNILVSRKAYTTLKPCNNIS